MLSLLLLLSFTVTMNFSAMLSFSSFIVVIQWLYQKKKQKNKSEHTSNEKGCISSVIAKAITRGKMCVSH